jgi:hypothetical protein
MGRMPGRTQMPQIEQISRKIEQWRKTRLRRTRMPDELWDAAVALAREHGVYATARDLRISYDGLKSRLDATPKRRARPSSLAFVELGPVAPISVTGSVVELVGASGAKLTIRLV